MIILKQKASTIVDQQANQPKNIAYVECYIKLDDGVIVRATICKDDKKLYNYFCKKNGFIIGEVAQLSEVENKIINI